MDFATWYPPPESGGCAGSWIGMRWSTMGCSSSRSTAGRWQTSDAELWSVSAAPPRTGSGVRRGAPRRVVASPRPRLSSSYPTGSTLWPAPAGATSQAQSTCRSTELEPASDGDDIAVATRGLHEAVGRPDRVGAGLGRDANGGP